MSVKVKLEGGGYVGCTAHFGDHAFMRHPMTGNVKKVKSSKGQVTSITVTIGGTVHEVMMDSIFVEVAKGGQLIATMTIEEWSFDYESNRSTGCKK
jgi:hypothetical protein